MLPAITSHKNVGHTFKAAMIRKALSSVNLPRFFRLYVYIMWCRLWRTGNRKCSRENRLVLSTRLVGNPRYVLGIAFNYPENQDTR